MLQSAVIRMRNQSIRNEMMLRRKKLISAPVHSDVTRVDKGAMALIFFFLHKLCYSAFGFVIVLPALAR